MNKTIHQGRNVKRFWEMMGLKQDGLAYMLADDWNQQKISLLEQKEEIDDPLLEQIAGSLKCLLKQSETLMKKWQSLISRIIMKDQIKETIIFTQLITKITIALSILLKNILKLLKRTRSCMSVCFNLKKKRMNCCRKLLMN